MSDIAVKVEGLGKRYRIGATVGAEDGRRSLLSKVTSPFHYLASTMRPPNEDEAFWALRDVSFEVKKGEVLGIIGRNGAGKSTLLKILSRITEPTEGFAQIYGRVGSLLEVGTGFHPELTGRENIYLNGAILGMRRQEIMRKFDEIVDFAGIEKFLDTPVKRYSSGMYVRLAFAVAAYLEPEILVVDEVLAVGDAAFQKKCLGKMEGVAKEGRTVLLVSHNMAAVQSLCHNGMVMVNGMKRFCGEMNGAVDFYLDSCSSAAGEDLDKTEKRRVIGSVRVTAIEIQDQQGNSDIPFPIGSELRFLLSYHSRTRVRNPRIVIVVYDSMSTRVTMFDTEVSGNLPGFLPETGQIVCSTQKMTLTPGRYYLNVACFDNGSMEEHLVHAAHFDIYASDFFGTGKAFDPKVMMRVLFKHDWEVVEE